MNIVPVCFARDRIACDCVLKQTVHTVVDYNFASYSVAPSSEVANFVVVNFVTSWIDYTVTVHIPDCLPA